VFPIRVVSPSPRSADLPPSALLQLDGAADRTSNIAQRGTAERSSFPRAVRTSGTLCKDRCLLRTEKCRPIGGGPGAPLSPLATLDDYEIHGFPLQLDLAERVLRVDLTERISLEQWQTVIDMVGEEAGSDRDLVIVLDGQSSGSGGEAVVDALVDALVVRGIKIRSITPGD
jgi:hypothetical protein